MIIRKIHNIKEKTYIHVNEKKTNTRYLAYVQSKNNRYANVIPIYCYTNNKDLNKLVKIEFNNEKRDSNKIIIRTIQTDKFLEFLL